MYKATPEVTSEITVPFHSFSIILLPLLWCESSFSAIFYHKVIEQLSGILISVFTSRQNKVDEIPGFTISPVVWYTSIKTDLKPWLCLEWCLLVLVTARRLCWPQGSQEHVCIQRHFGIFPPMFIKFTFMFSKLWNIFRIKAERTTYHIKHRITTQELCRLYQ